MIVKNCFSVFCAEELSWLLRAKLFDYTGSTLCKWRSKNLNVVYRGQHRSASADGIDVMTSARNSNKQLVNFADDLSLVDMDISSSDDDGHTDRGPVYSQQRVRNHSEYERKLPYSKRKLHETFTVCSFNVLAQKLLEAHPDLYRGCRKRDLKWSARFERLLKDFQETQPDILCLQEVEEQHFEDYFLKELENKKYKAIYKKRTNDKVDGCAIFYKYDKFDLIKFKTVELYREGIKLLERDNIGIIVMLAPKWRPDERIVVATTHLLYNPKRTDIRLTQTQYMLAEIEEMACRQDGKTYWPIIYTGDMNFTPDSPVYELLRNGYVSCNGISRQSFHRYPGSLLPQSAGITDTCQFASTLEKRFGSNARIVYGSGGLRHGLCFESVYRHKKGAYIEASTYQDQWHTVDYIFYSQKRGRSKVELLWWLGLPSDWEADKHLGQLPNQLCGSDHLLLCAGFHLVELFFTFLDMTHGHWNDELRANYMSSFYCWRLGNYKRFLERQNRRNAELAVQPDSSS